MAPGRKVVLFTGCLLVLAAGCGVLLADRESLLQSPVHWIAFVAAFLIAEYAVTHVEVRSETHTMSLSEAVLLVGLLTLSPVQVILARLVGSGLALGLRRQAPQKFAFNVALFTAEAAVGAVLLHGMLSPDSRVELIWLVGGLAVFCAGVLGGLAVQLVISFFDSDRPQGLMASVLRVQFVTAAASISLTIVGAAAISFSPINLAYIVLLLVGVFVLLREQAATAQRASDLQSVGQFTASLVGLTGTSDVVETSLREISQTMRGKCSALAISPVSGVSPQVFGLDNETLPGGSGAKLLELSQLIDEPMLLSDHFGSDTLPFSEGIVAPIVVAGHKGVVVVWERATDIGHFLSSEPRMLGVMVAQVQVALDRALLIDQLHYDAHHDALTQLPNRLGFSVQADLDLDAPIEDGTSGALFVLDLDRFKDINDTLGHPTGDQALVMISERLRDAVGEDEVLARLGGDEFAVFAPKCTSEELAEALAERLFAAIEAPILLEDLSLQLGASIGIALRPEHGQDLTALMRHADSAMYEAKSQQRGWLFYRHENDTNDPRRLELVSELRLAIDNRELDVWYQPRVSLVDGSVAGAEALARWNHPRFGFVPPDEFITLAEGAGLMRSLTDAILERVVSDICDWDRNGVHLQVAVNLSTRNLLDDSFPHRVREILSAHEIDTSRISFEITETAIMIDRERVAGLLHQLHDLGITLAIDDYGTGYSSLAYLRELPVNELKIDRSFVTNVDFDAHNEVIVRSTIDLAHNLGLVVIAEGIEREEERQMLAALGCDFGQGFLVSRPQPRTDFDTWLEIQKPTEPAALNLIRLPRA